MTTFKNLSPYSFLLFTILIAALKADELQFEFVNSEINGDLHRGIQFQTHRGLLYQIKASSDLKEWTQIAAIEGFDDSLIYPFLKIPSSSTTPPSGGSPPAGDTETPNVSVVLERLQGNGTIVSWKSLDSVGLTRFHAPSLTLPSGWDSIPFFFHAGTDYSYFLMVGPYLDVPPPTVTEPLGTEDQAFIAKLLADFPNIQTQAFLNPNSDAVLVAPSLGNSKYFKVEAVIADRDRDGIPDSKEIPTDQGGTGSNPNDPDTDDDGVWDGPEVAQDSDPNSDQETPTSRCLVTPPDNEEQGTSSTPLTAEIVEVGFHENIKMTSDNGITNYDAPHCVRGSHSYPVAYVRGGSVSLSGLVKIDGNPDSAHITAGSSSGISLTAELVEVGDNLWKFVETECNGTLVDTVKFYSAQNPDEAFDLTWTVAASFGTSVLATEAGTTRHTLYLTYQEPIQPFENHIGPRQETLFNIGCRNADGENDNTSNKIANLIYGEFTDQEIARVIPMQGALRDNDILTYYGDGPNADGASGVSGLLKSGDGSCGGFASFLNHLFRVQGINANITKVEPVLDDHFLLHNYQFAATGTSNATRNGIVYPFKSTTEVTNVAGRPAQGNPTPPKSWGQHCITESNGFLYDPSYGGAQTPPLIITIPFLQPIPLPDIKAFEDFNVVGFESLIDDQNAARLNDTTSQSPPDLKYQFVPSLN